MQRTILDEFLTRFKEAAAALVVGDPQDSKTNMGPVVSETHYNKVTSYLSIAEYEN
ncbi:aldehyde dehydrogenase family protein [Lysinibacillus parviboronicapiens]|uniref:aldehyde dehydrogenase family protein n=1 Tax=Lysinibacillus parviboronicapiens TaxID=436516 RepID=UPI002379888D|nr:aldehyde dehydrogenase family protein [Lysinibacillus parviboronicapiens]